MDFSGRLSAFPISNLLQWAATERRTGILVICRRSTEKWLSFEEGALLGCVSDSPADFFGPALLGSGQLDEQQLLEALTWAEEHNERLGMALVGNGVMSWDEAREALALHVRDQVCDLFLWEHGVFYFEERAVPEERMPPLPQDPQMLTLEGSRWVDETNRMRRLLVSDDMEVGPATTPSTDAQKDLAPLQVRVLRYLPEEGTSLEQLRRDVQGTHFRLLEAVFDLVVRGVVEPRSEGSATQDESQEIPLIDLLMERAAERRQALYRSRFSVPFDTVTGLYGLLVKGDPELEEVGLAKRLDGNTMLGDLFAESGDEEDERSYELLLDALRRGHLVLMPVAVSEQADDRGAAAMIRRLLRRS